jgi:hypothetical protein
MPCDKFIAKHIHEPEAILNIETALGIKTSTAKAQRRKDAKKSKGPNQNLDDQWLHQMGEV